MQFSGIGSSHDSEMHHVTNCMHEHAHYRKQEGSVGAGASSMESQAMDMMQKEQEGELSLSAWLDKMLGNGKRFLHGLWNGSGNASEGDGGRADVAQAVAEIKEETAAQPGAAGAGASRPDGAHMHTAQVAAASSAVSLPKSLQDNPYFSAVESAGGQDEPLLQKVKARFKDITGQLTGHLPGNFFSARNRGSFQARQEKPKEDLRKHSRFHGDELEIDCILTDDSYLLDSYDRKGEYSKLSAKK